MAPDNCVLLVGMLDIINQAGRGTAWLLRYLKISATMTSCKTEVSKVLKMDCSSKYFSVYKYKETLPMKKAPQVIGDTPLDVFVLIMCSNWKIVAQGKTTAGI